jgi:hypothetical protein
MPPKCPACPRGHVERLGEQHESDADGVKLLQRCDEIG